MGPLRPKHPNSDVRGDTWLEPEELCYPGGGQNRRAKARLHDGSLRTVRVGIPDTFFTIPGHLLISGKYRRGFLSVNTDTNEYVFHLLATSE